MTLTTTSPKPTLSAAVLATGLAALSPAHAVDVADPVQFQWQFHPAGGGNPEAYYSGTLQFGEASIDLGAGNVFNTRAYRQAGGQYSVPGPTIAMAPGNKYVLRFENTLPYEPASADTNVFKDPNVANVHTHGLHISGESPGDDVHRAFEGGTGGDYVWDIPADHMGGTFWYHAHHHGSSYLHVFAGAFGMLVIDDSNDGVPATVAGMQVRQLVLGEVNPAVAGTGGDQIVTNSFSAVYTANGLVGGTVTVPANEWVRFRVLHANDGGNTAGVSFGSCDQKLLARDGVWRTTAPADLPAPVSLTGASRADIAVRCSSPSAISVGGTDVAAIAVGPAGDGSVHPWDGQEGTTWSAARPGYLRDLRGEPAEVTTIRLGARTVMGRKFLHDDPNIIAAAGAVQQWDLPGTTGNHPFHLHVYHMQAVDCGGDAAGYENGEHYDTINEGCSVRFDLGPLGSPFAGRTIMHCHILDHEDQGAMGWMQVTGDAAGAPTFPLDTGVFPAYSEWYQLDAQPPVPPPVAPPVAPPTDPPVPPPVSPPVAPPTGCGNFICEVWDGEDCDSCPNDCASKTKGKNPYCCGQGADPCSYSGCNAEPLSCQASNCTPDCAGVPCNGEDGCGGTCTDACEPVPPVAPPAADCTITTPEEPCTSGSDECCAPLQCRKNKGQYKCI